MWAIIQADLTRHQLQIQELFWEYLSWANDRNEQEFGFRLDIRAMLDDTMAQLDKYVPPQGRILLAQDGSSIVGCTCLRSLNDHMGEVKRLYVRPTHRGQGIGRTLITELIEIARQAGFQTLRLDSSRYMTDAHLLYHAAGFRDIDPYPESEIPTEFHPWWFFMEMPLIPR